MPSLSGRGQMPLASDNPASDFHLAPCRDAEDGAAKLLQIVGKRIRARFGLDPIRDVQVLCPMNRAGSAPGHAASILQRALNSTGEPVPERFR